MAQEEDPGFGKSPVGAITSGLRRLFGAEPIAKTLIPSVLFAVALSITPTALLLFNNGHAIARSAPFYTAMAITAAVAASLVIALSQKLAPHVAGGLIAALGYGFYSLSWVPGSNELPSLTFFWLLTSLPGSVVVIWLLSNSRPVVTFAGIASSALAAFLLISPLTSTGEPSAGRTNETTPETLALASEPARTPNIYLFVLDGFANPRVTTEQFAEHNIDFTIENSIADLEKLGLQHDTDATSNYGQTILSMPSMLNASYPHTPDEPLPNTKIWSNGIPAIRGDNLLIDTLRSTGYDYWSASSGAWDPSRCDPNLADLCLGDDVGNAEAMKAVWWYTPLRWQLGVTDFRRLPEPQTVVDDILEARSTRESDTPYVVLSHIIGPHQPYRYEADCTFRDGSAPGATLEEGHLPEFRPLYANQARCLSEILVGAMNDLLEADPEALIFVQADHGSEFEEAGRSAQWSEAAARERLGVFRSTKMPDQCRSNDQRAQSVINTVPMILACVYGTEPDLIEPRHFFTDKSGQTNDVAETTLVLFE